jgi:hypothetical protein
LKARGAVQREALTAIVIGLSAGVTYGVASHDEPVPARFAVSVSVKTGSGDKPVISLNVTDAASATSQQFDVAAASGQEVEAAVLPDGSRVIITERVKYGKAATLVDLRKRQITDRLRGHELTVSPDNTKAVYVYHCPPHGSFDDVVVSYDFRLPPAQNASPGYRSDCPGSPSCPAPDRQYQRGIVVYPPENKQRQEFLSQSRPRLAVISPFAWCGTSEVAFLESRSTTVALITMHVPNELRETSVLTRTEVDRSSFLAAQYGDSIPAEFRDALPVARRLSFSDQTCRSLEITPYEMGPFGKRVTVSVH